MHRTLLLATDLTPASEVAAQKAIDLAVALHARLVVVNVINATDRVVGTLIPPSAKARVDQLRSDREGPLLAIVEHARSLGLESAFLLWTGEPGSGIVAAAEAENADMVVVGTRGLDRADRFLLGSVSDFVVYHATCPVLVAR
jgi:nucleotide-binding universal stress UspA family protein